MSIYKPYPKGNYMKIFKNIPVKKRVKHIIIAIPLIILLLAIGIVSTALIAYKKQPKLTAADKKALAGNYYRRK